MHIPDTKIPTGLAIKLQQSKMIAVAVNDNIFLSSFVIGYSIYPDDAINDTINDINTEDCSQYIL